MEVIQVLKQFYGNTHFTIINQHDKNQCEHVKSCIEIVDWFHVVISFWLELNSHFLLVMGEEEAFWFVSAIAQKRSHLDYCGVLYDAKTAYLLEND